MKKRRKNLGWRSKRIRMLRGLITTWGRRMPPWDNMRKRGDEAIKHFHRALRITPKYYGALLNLGILYYELGNFTNSVKAFERVLGINATENIAIYHLGLVYAEWKDIDAARAQAAILKKLDPEMAEELAQQIVLRAY